MTLAAQCSYRGGHASIHPKLVILTDFWAKWDGLVISKCQKPPKFLLDPLEGQEGQVKGGSWGQNERVWAKNQTLSFLMLENSFLYQKCLSNISKISKNLKFWKTG